MKHHIDIVGGGLAGLTLGIGLRRQGVPVTLWESNAYPRHKVCGEFISGAGLECLNRLSLSNILIRNGARPAETVLFASESHQTAAMRLPTPALCLSRYTLDHLLSRHFENLGGRLKEHSTWKKPFTTGTVRATGRSPRPIIDGWRWFGLKAHAQNVALTADLEMHLSRDAYVGLCRLNNDRVNVCGLFRNQPGQVTQSSGFDQLRGPKASLLHRRLENADFIPESFCSVAGLGLSPQSPEPTECRIGDAMTMIPPITGNGMSIGLESAEICTAPLRDYSESRIAWSEMLKELTRQMDNQFAERLFWAQKSHNLLFKSVLTQNQIIRLTRFPLFLRLLFRLTR